MKKFLTSLKLEAYLQVKSHIFKSEVIFKVQLSFTTKPFSKKSQISQRDN